MSLPLSLVLMRAINPIYHIDFISILPFNDVRMRRYDMLPKGRYADGAQSGKELLPLLNRASPRFFKTASACGEDRIERRDVDISKWRRSMIRIRACGNAASSYIFFFLFFKWPLTGWVRRWYRYHPLPEELGVRLAPHPAQAARREFLVSDRTPYDRCSRVTFTRLGIQLFLWMSARLLVVSTSHPATSAPFRGGQGPIRRVMSSPCLSAAGLRFLAVLSHWSLSATLRWAYCQRQTPLGFPRST
jgi:hypothetical protein